MSFICKFGARRAASVLRTPTTRFSSIIRQKTTTATDLKAKYGLTPQIFPINKETISEQDVDEWLNSLQNLKNGRTPETATEIYLDELASPEQYLKKEFTPTEEQIADKERLENTKIPLLSVPVVENLVNLIMRHGKKSKAKRVVSRALFIVYLKLRLDPVVVLRDTLNKLAPLMNTKVEKTGNAKNRVVPYPLTERQGYRYAILWILDGASKKKSPDFSVRLAEELISAYEGKSAGYDKKIQMHKSAISQRAYIKI